MHQFRKQFMKYKKYLLIKRQLSTSFRMDLHWNQLSKIVSHFKIISIIPIN